MTFSGSEKEDVCAPGSTHGFNAMPIVRTAEEEENQCQNKKTHLFSRFSIFPHNIGEV